MFLTSAQSPIIFNSAFGNLFSFHMKTLCGGRQQGVFSFSASAGFANIIETRSRQPIKEVILCVAIPKKGVTQNLVLMLGGLHLCSKVDNLLSPSHLLETPF